MSFLETLKFNADGLIPAIIQEQKSGRVLMMAWMNKEAIRRTIEEGKTVFWSRSRQKYWVKGESSGNVQLIKDVSFDCDGDTLLFQVEQKGAACHEGYQSCFFRSVREQGNKFEVTEPQLIKPEEMYREERMIDEFTAFASPEYLVLLACVVFARSMDFLSTWVATPNLMLEANPIARKMGWKLGIVVNLALCFLFAFWPLPAVVITTTSLLVAARNFQSAWLMRSMGEMNYRLWMMQRLNEAPGRLFIGCVFAQSALFALLGGVLMFFSGWLLVPFGVGMGMITYALAVAIYTTLSVWRLAFRRL